MTNAEVKELLSYEDVETTNELHTFGAMLMAECVDRGKQLDTRAIALSGYSGVTAALLISTFASRIASMEGMAVLFVMGAGVSLFLTTALALGALWIRDYEWFSDNDWLAPSLLGDGDALRRFHVLATHRYLSQHNDVNARKAQLLRAAYFFIILCGGMLAAGLVATRF